MSLRAFLVERGRTREYLVTLTMREHFVVKVTARDPAEATSKARRGEWDDEPTNCGDRTIIAAKVRRADRDAS